MQKTQILIPTPSKLGKLYNLGMRLKITIFKQAGRLKRLKVKYSRFSQFGKNLKLTMSDSPTSKLFGASALGDSLEYFCLDTCQRVDSTPSSLCRRRGCLRVGNSVWFLTREILWWNSTTLRSWNYSLHSKPSILLHWHFNVHPRKLRLPGRIAVLLPEEGQAHEWGLGQILFCGDPDGHPVPAQQEDNLSRHQAWKHYDRYGREFENCRLWTQQERYSAFWASLHLLWKSIIHGPRNACQVNVYLSRSGHTFSVDYYCLGALLYELVTGSPPYYSRDV